MQQRSGILPVEDDTQILVDLPENSIFGIACQIGFSFGNFQKYLVSRSSPCTPDGLRHHRDEIETLIDAMGPGI